jgi:hypothetical protein
MNRKFAIFMLISGVLAAAIYSSSVSYVFGKTACSSLPGSPNDYVCTNDKTKQFILCIKTKTGYDCEYLTHFTDTNIPPALSGAVDAVIQETQNTTKGPKTDFQEKSGLLGGNSNDTSEQATASQNRFCMEGTGGTTGRDCIPCDPGLRFEVGCIDILTGGPLDLETATSESGKNNTKVPKDLGGLLEEDGSTEGNDDTEVPKVPGGLKGDE